MSDKQPKDSTGVDARKRETLRSLVIGSAYVVPVIASFSMRDVNVLHAQCYTGNLCR